MTILIGIIIGLLLASYVRMKGHDFLLLCIFLPAIYVLFAIVSSTPTQSIIEEMFFGMPIFMLVGISQMQEWGETRKLKVACGVWLFHAGYDYVHHWLVINDGVPQFYPHFCLGVDIAVAGYIFWTIQQSRKKNTNTP